MSYKRHKRLRPVDQKMVDALLEYCEMWPTVISGVWLKDILKALEGAWLERDAMRSVLAEMRANCYRLQAEATRLREDLAAKDDELSGSKLLAHDAALQAQVFGGEVQRLRAEVARLRAELAQDAIAKARG